MQYVRFLNQATKVLLVALTLSPVLTGCGGGGSSSSETTANKPLVFSIAWADRNRSISPPSSTLSVLVTIKGASSDGSDLTTIANRENNRVRYTQNVTIDQGFKAGTWPVTVTCYSEPGGKGAVVGTAQAEMTIASDGTGVANIAVNGTIAFVAVTPGQIAGIATKSPLLFTCRDASGALVPVSQDSAFPEVLSGGAYLRIAEGQIVGVSPGVATVRATVDGIQSPPETVQVVSPATISISPTEFSMFVGTKHAFSASVAGIEDTRILWTVQEGLAGGDVAADGTYQAPKTPGTYHVIATSLFDPSKKATATVTVVSGNALVVYENDFKVAAGSEWSKTTIETTPTGARPFLGRFGKEDVKLSLPDLPAHSKLTVSFKLFIIRSWDGNVVTNVNNNVVGPDIWSLSLDSTSILRTTFGNWEPGSTPDNVIQSYPNAFGGETSPSRTGASENNTLGYPSFKPQYPGPVQDSVYDLTYTVPHTAGTATFTFSGLETVNDGIESDESWGITDVKVTATP